MIDILLLAAGALRLAAGTLVVAAGTVVHGVTSPGRALYSRVGSSDATVSDAPNPA